MPTRLILILLLPLTLAAQPDRVLFSQPGGRYPQPFLLTLTNTHPQNTIRYTLNGSIPTAQSAAYTHPITLDTALYAHSDFFRLRLSYSITYQPDTVQRCIVIRAAPFDDDGNRVGNVVTNSYFIRSLVADTHQLPILSICADSLALFDFDTGIMVPGRHFDTNNAPWTGNYYQTGRQWERLCNVEYYSPDNQFLNQQAGLRAHGHYTRTYPQKGLRLYARSEYGDKYFNLPLFPQLPFSRYKRLVLHPFTYDAHSAGIQDAMCNALAANLNLEAPASRPVVLYLNGEYWGIYYLREKTDEHFLSQHLGVDPDNLTIVEDWHGTTDVGDSTAFIALVQWLQQADLTDTADYAHLLQLVDIDSFIDYYLLQLFIANDDWPANNMRCWSAPAHPWRWIFSDGDHALYNTALDVFANATYDGSDTYPSSSQATLMFRRCLENEDFVTRFVARANNLLATLFAYDATHPHLRAQSLAIRSEIPRQVHRFAIPYQEDFWQQSILLMDDFLRQRPDRFADQLADFLHLQQPVSPALYDVVAYPNPSAGPLTLRFHSPQAGTAQLAIFDLRGQCAYRMPLLLLQGDNSLTLAPPLPAGLYLLRIGDTTLRIVRL